MGGRGSSSGISEKNHQIYGTEYSSVYSTGNIKFLTINSGSPTAPMETMTKGRVYVTLGSDNIPKFISYYDKNNRRFKQIDITGKKHRIDRVPTLPHTHKGYEHDEHGTFKNSYKEEKMIERVLRAWDYHLRSK